VFSFFVKYPERNGEVRLSNVFGEDTVLFLYGLSSGSETVNKGGTGHNLFPSTSAKEKVTSWLGKGLSVHAAERQRSRRKNEERICFSFFVDLKKYAHRQRYPRFEKRSIDEALRSDGDAWDRSCTDGGYYLIGFQRNAFWPSIFEGCSGAPVLSLIDNELSEDIPVKFMSCRHGGCRHSGRSEGTL